MGYVDRSPLNYRVNTTDPLAIRRETRAPIDNQDGLNDRLLTLWHDESSDDVYMLVQRSKAQTTSTWRIVAGTGVSVEEFLVSSGTSPVVPNASNQITLVDGNGVGITGGLNQWTTNMVSPFTGNFTFTGTVTADTFQTSNATAAIEITDNAINMNGSDANVSLIITPKGTGGAVITTNLTVGETVQDVDFVINGASIRSTIALHTSGVADLGGFASQRHSDTAAFGSHTIMIRSRGTEAAPTVVQNNDSLSRVISGGYDGVNGYAQAAEIRVEVDGVPGAADMPGRIRLFTSQDGTQVPVEAARFDSNQDTTLYGDLSVTRAQSGGDVFALVSNTSNTASSTATIKAQVAGASAGDPIISWVVNGVTQFDSYIDNTDADSLKFDLNGTGTYQKFFTTGERLLPFQPFLLASLSATQANVTGNGTQYNMICDTVTSDVGSNYNSGSGLYTFPVTGFYMYECTFNMGNIGAGMTDCTAGVRVNGVNGPSEIMINPVNGANSSNIIQYDFYHMQQHTAGNTLQPFIVISGGAGDTVSAILDGCSFKLALLQ